MGSKVLERNLYAMTRILFVCHGNICRSPMAQLVMEELARRRGLEGEILCDSAATSTEELGNPIHPGTRRTLGEEGIPLREHRSVQMTRKDYDRYDLLVGMDQNNRRNMMRILRDDPRNKVCLLLDFSRRPGDIADPWYTGNFDLTYQDVLEGCQGLLDHLFPQK